ncbi:MAG: hypothetical protein CVT98_03500 [Bacteroidetes bacterium HGW-Bacteroidetes-15]|nr:MAG: hypothetical protein CVT98_03500 [Bacteroidetes bacterium HGW-Bacteroidetes-15]
MKKLSFLLVFAAMFAFVACGPSDKKVEEAKVEATEIIEEATEKADSIVEEAVEAAEEIEEGVN